MGKSTVATSIRVPDDFLNDIKRLADRIGDSQNGMMLNLMALGLKVYEGKITTQIDQE